MYTYIKTGVVLKLGDKFWNTTYSDGQCTCKGWSDIQGIRIHNPRFCKQPSDMSYNNDPDLEEKNKGKLVSVKCVTTYYLSEDEDDE